VPARLIEGGAVALRETYSRTDSHPEPVVVVVVVVMLETAMPRAGTDALRTDVGTKCALAGAEYAGMG
jgi:hypothetical protein